MYAQKKARVESGGFLQDIWSGIKSAGNFIWSSVIQPVIDGISNVVNDILNQTINEVTGR